MSRRILPLLLVLFVGSGCAALIYEIVWFQLLQFVVGSSAVSLAVLLGTFMGGMCLGSLALPRLVSAARHPLRVYALLELGIGLAGVLVLFAMPAVGRFYVSSAGHGLPGILLRGVVCAGCLLPPTMLMGATLPAIARWVETTPRGISWLGIFYGGNTVGAVGGCLVAGFYLLRLYDLATATWCAVALNLTVALLAFGLAGVAPRPARVDSASAENPPTTPPGARAVWLTIALSGACALSAEVIWTRLLSLLLGATVYTFSIILAVFLAGLGLGSSLGSLIARHTLRPRFALGCCQLLQVAAIAWAAHAVTRSLPFWPIDPVLAMNAGLKFRFDLVRCAWAILPAAGLWGASFPLALAATTGGLDSGRLVSRIYAANTLGAIIGAVLTSLVLFPWLGTRQTEQLLIALSALGAVLAFAPRSLAGWSSTAMAMMLAVFVGLHLPSIPWQLVAYGRQFLTGDQTAKLQFFGEGINASVAVTETAEGARYFHVSGKTEASSLFKDMRLQRMLGHIPALFHPQPRSVLIVGCGAGVTAGSFVPHPSISRIVICEIEPLIPRAIATRFEVENHDVLHDRRVEVIYDDARHYLATTPEKFDIITSDPIHPWVKGAAVLYSQEYFQLCRQHLNPGGFVTQWVPFYESNRAAVQSEIATFFSVFPHGTVWGNDDEGYGYDVVMLGQIAPLRVDAEALQQRLDRSDHAAVKHSLASVNLGSAASLLDAFAGLAADLKTWLKTAELNQDRSLRLQYLAGRQLDSNLGAAAYGELLRYRRMPAEIFPEKKVDPPLPASTRP
ncbi:MAG: SAM-dependent methyltransferase [Opitutus sp.]|nr:SAM-dependent methyltransferase [Opitutus sp.]